MTYGSRSDPPPGFPSGTQRTNVNRLVHEQPKTNPSDPGQQQHFQRAQSDYLRMQTSTPPTDATGFSSGPPSNTSAGRQLPGKRGPTKLPQPAISSKELQQLTDHLRSLDPLDTQNVSTYTRARLASQLQVILQELPHVEESIPFIEQQMRIHSIPMEGGVPPGLLNRNEITFELAKREPTQKAQVFHLADLPRHMAVEVMSSALDAWQRAGEYPHLIFQGHMKRVRQDVLHKGYVPFGPTPEHPSRIVVSRGHTVANHKPGPNDPADVVEAYRRYQGL